MRPLCSALVALGLLGCESHSRKAPISETSLPIVGGNLATTCQWPTAILPVESVGCSGALVHPRVVVTAKHCLVEGGDPTSIGLGETRDQWAKTVDVSRCYAHPVNDFGICILAQDVTSIPIVPVMAPCEMSALATGAAVVEVGFGVTVPNPRGAYGTKKSIGGSIVTASPDEVDINVTTASQDGEYYGDSGGPLFFQMPDGTWRVIGEDWGSPTIVGGSATPRVSTYKSVPYHVAWAEQVSGIDLTPCHDANGWNPTADCTGFPTNPGDGVGSWTTLCQGETMLRQPTCQGAPPDADASGQHAEAGGEAGGREGPRDGSVDANARDSSTGDSGADVSGDCDTGWAYGGNDGADTGESRQTGDATDSGETSADAPGQGPDSSAGSGGNAGAGGSSADGSGGSAGAGGSSTAQSARDGASLESAGEGKTSDSGNPRADATSDGGDAHASVESDLGGDAGSDISIASDGGEATVDGGVDQKSGRPSGSGCTCSSASDRDAGAWPGLLGLGLTAACLIRRRTRR